MRRYGGIVVESTRIKFLQLENFRSCANETIDKDLKVRRYEGIVIESTRNDWQKFGSEKVGRNPSRIDSN